MICRICFYVCFLLALLFYPATLSAQQTSLPVDVANPLVKTVREWDEYTGRFQAVDRVELRARVSGYLESIHFRDGQLVEKGDLLFIIDPRPFEAALEAAQARVRSAKAQLALSTAELKRGEELRQRNVLSVSEVDKRRAQRDVDAAAVLVAEADVRTAQLNLEFTEVKAPVSGRISDSRADVGNLISGGSTDASLLATIVSLDPIQFVFDVSESAFLKYVRLDREGKRPGSRTTPNPVYVRLADEEDWPHRGVMDFVDNEVGQATGTLRGRAVLKNPDRLLTPGLFGKLRLLGSGAYQAVLIPDDAILSDQADKIVMTVDENNAVSIRKVAIGPIIDGLRVVREGLSAEDRIIVAGVQRVRDGQEVAPNPVEVKARPDGFDPVPTDQTAEPASTTQKLQ